MGFALEAFNHPIGTEHGKPRLHSLSPFGAHKRRPSHNPSKTSICPTITNLSTTTTPSSPTIPPLDTDKMNGEDPPERPDYITNIINGLERYNPEAVGSLETYLQEQCEQKFCDSNANRTLLKL